MAKLIQIKLIQKTKIDFCKEVEADHLCYDTLSRREDRKVLISNKKKSRGNKKRKKLRKDKRKGEDEIKPHEKDQSKSKEEKVHNRTRNCGHGNKSRKRNYRKSRSKKKVKKSNPVSLNPLNIDFSGEIVIDNRRANEDSD